MERIIRQDLEPVPELEIPVMFRVLFLLSPGGGGVLPYMGFIGMCRCEGMVFKQFTPG